MKKMETEWMKNRNKREAENETLKMADGLSCNGFRKKERKEICDRSIVLIVVRSQFASQILRFAI
ncbi:MAG: hypothetical protein DI535_20580 [Citrobacter freundii]|nr:MAG: hypothetical protein DI535_20580 [Citrobacter freundii]